jgi:hypothetical protein
LLLVISSAAARAQELAPSQLFTSSADEPKKHSVQGSTKESAQVIAKKAPQAITNKLAPLIAKEKTEATTKAPAQVITKKRAPVISKKRTQPLKTEPSQAIAKESVRTFTAEPVRPMGQQSITKPTQPFGHFSFKTPEGKKESASLITQYYPKRIVYPYAKIDRHIDSRLMQAATIAQERAHAHSRSMCWHYVKEALLAAGVINSRPQSELARDAAQDLVSNYGFKRLSVTDPFSAPVGSVLVYGTSRTVGHVELRTTDGFVSDFVSRTPSRRPLLGVYAKL